MRGQGGSSGSGDLGEVGMNFELRRLLSQRAAQALSFLGFSILWMGSVCLHKSWHSFFLPFYFFQCWELNIGTCCLPGLYCLAASSYQSWGLSHWVILQTFLLFPTLQHRERDRTTSTCGKLTQLWDGQLPSILLWLLQPACVRTVHGEGRHSQFSGRLRGPTSHRTCILWTEHTVPSVGLGLIRLRAGNSIL